MRRSKRTSRILLSAVGMACTCAWGCAVAVTPPTVGFTRPAITYTAPVVSAPAVEVAAAPAEAAPEPAAAGADPQLDQLVAPIALYPDPLLAQLLPASTYPDQVQAAALWLQQNPDPADDAIQAQPWAPNVQALVHYPVALEALNNDPQWTQSLGSAFNTQSADVMAAIQDMRAQAQVAGNLASSPQVNVIADAGVISIQPVEIAAPLFVPTYDPVTVYASPLVIGWSAPYVVGPWLGFGVDWDGGAVFAGPWYGGWYHDGGWGRDFGFRYDHFHNGWRHDDHFGHAPHVDRAHFAVARGVHGREGAFKQAIARHSAGVNNLRDQARNSTAPKRLAQATTPEKPVKATTPRKPVKATTPQKPTKATTLEKPTKATTPEKPTKATTPEKPTKATTPEKPAKSASPQKPAAPQKPAPPEKSKK